MKIQQHDGVVVDAAGSRQGFAKRKRGGRGVTGRREAPGLLGCCSHAPRVGNPRGGGASTCLGGYSTPLAAAPLGDPISYGGRTP